MEGLNKEEEKTHGHGRRCGDCAGRSTANSSQLRVLPALMFFRGNDGRKSLSERQVLR